MEQKHFLEIKDLEVIYTSNKKIIRAVNGVSLHVDSGTTLGLVGETGAGKTTIAKAIMRTLPNPPAQVLNGQILLEGDDLLQKTEKEMCDIRGKRVAMIFQDPMTALNPIMPIGDQIVEVIRLHSDLKRSAAQKRAGELLEMVGIPTERLVEYPHQFSGGMKQRVVIAMALACSPDLLLADEPTTALDVTIQAQVLDLINELKTKYGTSLILITHDLGVIAETCDNVAVIYAGQIVEYGTKRQVFKNAMHPYTEGLFNSLPKLKRREARLTPIEGMPPDPTNLPKGCSFYPRCPYAREECQNNEIPFVEYETGHFCRCAYGKKEV